MQYKIHRLSAPFVPMNALSKLGPKLGYREDSTFYESKDMMRTLEPLRFNEPIYLNWRDQDNAL